RARRLRRRRHQCVRDLRARPHRARVRDPAQRRRDRRACPSCWIRAGRPRRPAAGPGRRPARRRRPLPRADRRTRLTPVRVPYSPKVFIPLTRLCRDVCHYCTFARPPRPGERAYLTPDEVLEIARAGAGAGCHEALFTLGDKPELRYRAAREELEELGCATTIEYLARACEPGLAEPGLRPTANPGGMP